MDDFLLRLRTLSSASGAPDLAIWAALKNRAKRDGAQAL